MTDIKTLSVEKHDVKQTEKTGQKWKKIYHFNSLTIEIQVAEDQSQDEDTSDDTGDICLDEGPSPGSSSDESPVEREKRLRVSKEI